MEYSLSIKNFETFSISKYKSINNINVNLVTPISSCTFNKRSNNYYFSSASFLSQLSINARSSVVSRFSFHVCLSTCPCCTLSNVIIWTPGRKRMSHKESGNDDPKHRSWIFCYEESLASLIMKHNTLYKFRKNYVPSMLSYYLINRHGPSV